MRLSGYDYSLPSIYFVTLCTYHHQILFGDIEEDQVRLSPGGQAVKQAWESMPSVIPGMLLDVYTIMPDHFHAIFGFVSIDGSAQDVSRAGLPSIIRRFKTYTMHLYGEQMAAGRIAPYREHLWQRNYWDRIIRSDADLEKHREYIYNNALKKYIFQD